MILSSFALNYVLILAVFCQPEKALYQVEDSLSCAISNHGLIYQFHVFSLRYKIIFSLAQTISAQNSSFIRFQVPHLTEPLSGLCQYLDNLSMRRMWYAAAVITLKNTQVIRRSSHK